MIEYTLLFLYLSSVTLTVYNTIKYNKIQNTYNWL